LLFLEYFPKGDSLGGNVVEIYSKIIIRYIEIIKDRDTSVSERLSALKTLRVISANDAIFKKAALESFGTFMIPAVVMNLFTDKMSANDPDLSELENTAATCLADLCMVQSLYFKSLVTTIFLYICKI
jgi:hypothetical protein